MSHPNARLTPKARRNLVREVAAGWTRTGAAQRFRVSRATAAKQLHRYRGEGEAVLLDRCSRRYRSPRLTALSSAAGTGQPARSCAAIAAGRASCDAPAPRSRGRIPPGGGKWFAPGFAGTGSGPIGQRGIGLDYVHVAVDDRPRCACAEALPNERGPPAAAFLERAVAASSTSACGSSGRSRTTAGTAKRRLPRDGSGARRGAATDAAVPAAEQRQGRGLRQDPAGRVGVPSTLRLERGAPRRPPGLPAGVRSRPSARRHRRGRPRLPPVNNVSGIYSYSAEGASWPYSSQPQQRIEPSRRMPQLWVAPALIAEKRSSAGGDAWP